MWEADPWGRAAFGLPPASYGDYAWVQQMVASMAEDSGRMAVVLPQGALFRKGAEGRIRRALLEQDLIEAVVGLAPNIFYGTGLAPAVVTFRRTKRRGRRGKVVVIDASSLFRKGRAQNVLGPVHAEEIGRGTDLLPDRRHRRRRRPSGGGHCQAAGQAAAGGRGLHRLPAEHLRLDARLRLQRPRKPVRRRVDAAHVDRGARGRRGGACGRTT